jgi:hypothetical protein
MQWEKTKSGKSNESQSYNSLACIKTPTAEKKKTPSVQSSLVEPGQILCLNKANRSCQFTLNHLSLIPIEGKFYAIATQLDFH